MEKIKILELFAGVGACSKAFERLGIPHEIVDAVEIDKFAIASFNAVHGTNFDPQDITKWDKDIDVDFIMHGSPCQDFSVAGKQRGGDEGSGTRSSLMYETLRIVEKLKPKYVIWENVKNLISKKHRHNFDAYIQQMDDLGYNSHYQVLNAKNYGVPQNRERVFTVSIRKDLPNDFTFPEPFPLEKKLKDVLETNVDEKYYLSQKQLNGMKRTNFNSYKLETLLRDKDGEAKTLTARFEGCPQLVDDPFIVASRGRGENNEQTLEPRKDGNTNTITTVAKDNYVAEPTFVGKHYSNFQEKNGYTPEMFNPYNEAEIKDVAPTMSTQCGSSTSSAAVLIDDTYKNREPREYEEYAPTLRAGRQGLKIKVANKKGYDEAYDGDSVNLSYPNSTTRRGRVGHEVSQTLDTGCNIGVVEDTRNMKEKLCDELIEKGIVHGGEIVNHSYTTSEQRDTLDKYIETKDGTTPTLTTRPDILGYVENNMDNYRIRKLTPKECWRLQGFDDEDFEKAAQVNSNAQLYKQAGNSICVNVLEHILKNLIK